MFIFYLMLGREMNEFMDYRGERPLQEEDIDATIERVKENWEKMLSVIYPAVTLRKQQVSKQFAQRMDKVVTCC